MQNDIILQMALGLSSPWYVRESVFDGETQQAHIHIDFKPEGTFACPQCRREACGVHDTEEQTWRRPGFFQYEAVLHVRVPRVDCPGCGIHAVSLPWAGSGSGCTRLPTP